MKHLYEKEKVTREELAYEVGKLADQYQHFLFDVVMRTGKSMLFTELCKKWEGKILILSAADSTNKQWRENLEKYNPQLLERVDIYCYHSLHKLDRNAYSIIGLDEYELSRSDRRSSQIFEFTPVHWVAMSGTLSFEDRQEFRLLTNNKFYNVKVDLTQAVKWGILPQPKVYAIKLEMDNTKRYLLYHKGKDKSKRNEIVTFDNRWESIKNTEVNTLIQCTEQEYNELLEQDYGFFKGLYDRNPTYAFKLKWLKKGNERKQFYGSLKPQHFKKLYSQLPKDSRCLIFCVDTKQADFINKEFAVHSNRPGSLDLVEEFNSKRINVIATVKMLDRGVDFFDVDYVIIIQQSGKQNSPLQQMGRSLLSVAPKIITFYYPGTQDEKYVQGFLRNFEDSWVIHKKL